MLNKLLISRLENKINLYFSFSNCVKCFLIFYCFFISIIIASGKNNHILNKDTTIVICENSLNVSKLNIKLSTINGSWRILSGSATINSTTTFATVFNNINSGNSNFIWTSIDDLEVIIIRISNRKPLAKIVADPVSLKIGNVLCGTRFSLIALNPQQLVASSIGTWSTVQQPTNNTDLAYLSPTFSPLGDTIYTTANNLNENGNYIFKWKVTEPTCGADSAIIEIQNKRNIAKILNPEQFNKNTCGLPMVLLSNKPTVSSLGNWKLGKIEDVGTQRPIFSILSSTLTTISTEVSNFRKPGSYDLYWVVNSLIVNECPADSQLITINNVKPLAELDYNQQFVDVCGSTILKANNPALSGSGLTGKWILDRQPINSPNINTSNLLFNSLVNFPRPGNYYFKWVVQRENPACTSDTALVIFNNIRPFSVNAGKDTTVCSSLYELKGSDRNNENLPNAKGVWTIFSQPAQNEKVVFDDSTRSSTLVRNINKIGVYGFIWTVSTSSTLVPNCSRRDSVFITNHLHAPFVSLTANVPFCDTLKLVSPKTEYPIGTIVPTERWALSEGSGQNTSIKLINQPDGSLISYDFPKSGEYKLDYVFSYSGCSVKNTYTVESFMPPIIEFNNKGRNFCTDSIQLSAPTIAAGFIGAWEKVAFPNGSVPVFKDSTQNNTFVTNFLKPGNYGFIWTLKSTNTNVACARTSEVLTYINQKASKLPDSYRLDTNFCGPNLSVVNPTLDPDFVPKNTGWTIINTLPNITKTAFGDTTTFSNFGDLRRISLLWVAANTNNLSCQRKDTIIRVNQHPFAPNAAGIDKEVCSKETTINLEAKIPVNYPNSKGVWRLVSLPSSAKKPVFLSDSTSINMLINNFSTSGEYRFSWNLSNLSCRYSDEVIVRKNSVDTLFAKANNEFTCKNFDTLKGYKAPKIDFFKNSTYLWKILSQPAKIGVFEKASIADSLSHEAIINGMFSTGKYIIEYSIKNGNCVSRDTILINRSPFFDAVVPKDKYYTCEDTLVIEAFKSEVIGRWELVSGASKEPIPITTDNTKAKVTGLIDNNFDKNIFDWVIAPLGCPERRKSVQVIKFKKPPFVKFNIKTLRVCEDNFITLESPSHQAFDGQSNWKVTGDTAVFATLDTVPVSNLKYGLNNFDYTLIQKYNENKACESNTASIAVWRDSIFSNKINYQTEGIDKALCGDTLTIKPSLKSNVNFSVNQPVFNPSPLKINLSNNIIFIKDILQSGVYKIYISAERGACKQNDTINFKKGKIPSVAKILNFDDIQDTLCESDKSNAYTFIAQKPSIGSRGYWSINNQTSINDTNLVRIVELSLGANTIQWITDVDGSCISVNQKIVVVNLKTPKSYSGIDRTVYSPEGKLDALNNIQNTPNKGQWGIVNNTQIVIDEIDNPNTMFRNLPIGKNIFYWKITNATCEPEIDSVIITRLETKIPKGFSPNNDEFNQTFTINGIHEYPIAELEVFNRWGDVVYKNNKYNNDWNGVSKDGKPLPDDTYFYVLKLGIDNEIRSFLVIKR
ncbi:MAG: gliding motility-associated C-terminal domain-containing protein [Cytophagales bacterium]|nr:MAG: gliding motility-associated C-terminal domain-containing protein [Cytophagales bacterium]